MPKIKCPKCGNEFTMTKTALFPPKSVMPSRSKEIAELIEIFAEINPTINYGHRGMRADAEYLIDRFGMEKAVNTAKFAVSIQGQPYSPTITTPTALRYKLGDLLVFHKKTATGRTTIIE